MDDGAPYEGILGLGYCPVLYGDGILTPLDNMYDQKLIRRKMFSVYTSRNSNGDSQDGEILFGGESTSYSGDFGFVPLTNDGFWSINVDRFVVNNKSISSNAVGCVDTGTSLISVPSDHFVAINEAISVTSKPMR